MTQTQFNAAAIVIFEGFSFEEIEPLTFTKKTQYGKLRVWLETDKSAVFSVYMRFETFTNFVAFRRLFGVESFNQHSWKWNIHVSNPAVALAAFENRLEGLTYPM